MCKWSTLTLASFFYYTCNLYLYVITIMTNSRNYWIRIELPCFCTIIKKHPHLVSRHGGDIFHLLEIRGSYRLIQWICEVFVIRPCVYNCLKYFKFMHQQLAHKFSKLWSLPLTPQQPWEPCSLQVCIINLILSGPTNRFSILYVALNLHASSILCL